MLCPERLVALSARSTRGLSISFRRSKTSLCFWCDYSEIFARTCWFEVRTTVSVASMQKAKDHRRDENIWFYKIGLGASDTATGQGWTVKTLRLLIDMCNDTGVSIPGETAERIGCWEEEFAL